MEKTAMIDEHRKYSEAMRNGIFGGTFSQWLKARDGGYGKGSPTPVAVAWMNEWGEYRQAWANKEAADAQLAEWKVLQAKRSHKPPRAISQRALYFESGVTNDD